MQKAMRALALVCVCSLSLHLAKAQQPQAPAQQSTAAVAEPEAPRVVLQGETTASVLRLMKFSGALRDRAGNARTGAMGLTFALYKDQQGGSPLWLEVHNAQLDEQGRYTVLLGSTKSEGLPLELFSTGEARWLGVQLNLPGEEEQPRVLLVSVPYALKAADAETLGGKPPSAFLLADPVGADLRVRPEPGKEAVKEGPERQQVISGTVGRIAKFVGPNPDDVGDSIITESASKIGIGTASPSSKLQVVGQDDAADTASFVPGTNTGAAGLPSMAVGIGAPALPGQTLHVRDAHNTGAYPLNVTNPANSVNWLTITSGGQVWMNGGSVGIGTAAPSGKLRVVGQNDAPDFVSFVPGADTGAAGLPSMAMGIGAPAIAGQVLHVRDPLNTGALPLNVTNPANSVNWLTVTNGGQVWMNGGNVGIGTASPGQKLTVAGTVESTSGGFKFPDGTTQTTAGAGGGTATDLNCAAPCVSTAELADLSVSAAKLQDASVVTGKLADASVSSPKLADFSVTTIKLADLSVTTTKLADNSVTSSKLAALSVTNANLAATSVDSSKLADSSVTTSKIADATVTSSKVDFNFAGSSSKGGIATNADLLDGLDSTAFAVTAHNHDAAYVNVAGDTMVGTLNLPANGLVAGTNQLVLSGGNVGIGTATPSSILSLGGNDIRTLGMERNTVANTVGNSLVLQAGGAASGATDKQGGELILSAGTATGTGGSLIAFRTATPGASGTADNTPSTKMIIDGAGNVGIGTPSPAQKLTVAGTIESTSGGFKFPDGTTQATAGGGGTATDLNCATPCVSTAELVDLSVTSTKLANNSVVTAKLADNSVDSSKLANASVVTVKLAPASVDSSKLADNSVLAASLADGSVLTAKLANASVDTFKIADGAVTAAKVNFNYAGSATPAGKANDAELLDGLDSSAFAAAGHNHDAAYVNVTGDTMVGTLNLPPNGLVAGTNQLVLSGGNVGIGTAIPAAKLDVNGSIKISTTTRIFSIPCAAFTPFSSTFTYSRCAGPDKPVVGTTAATSVTFFAPVFLPDGATITLMEAVVKDSDGSENIGVSLNKAGDGAAGIGLAFAASSGTPGVTTLSAGVSHTVNNATGAYFVEAAWGVPAVTTDIALYSVRIHYTITTPLP